MSNVNLPIWQAEKAVSLSPAQSIGEADMRGSLSEGKYADIVIADDKINIVKTFFQGDEVY